MFGYNYDVEELFQVINKLDVDKDVLTTRRTLRKILMTSSGGKNMEKLFPAVVKHLSSSDLITKKLVSWFICEHGSNEEFILLAINTLVKDCNDSNPMIRGFSLKTITSIPHAFMLDYSLPLVLKGLDDSSAYVRRAAVLSCVMLSRMNHEVMMENGIVDRLYEAIRDSDLIVVVDAMLALEEILSFEGGAVINYNIAVYLLNKLQMFAESQLPTVMMFLAKYTPANSQETLDIMNIIDPYLRSGSPSVLVQTLKYFLQLVGDNPDIKQVATERAKDQLLHLMNTDNPEMTFMLLEIVETLLTEFIELFQPHHQLFFCRYNEPLYIKAKKIALLSSLASESSLPEIVEELGMYSLDTVQDVARCAVNGLCKVASKFPMHMSRSVDVLVNLLDLRDNTIVPDVLNVLQRLDLSQLSNLEDILRSLEKCASAVELLEARPAMLWLLGEYGERLDSSPYLLEEFAEELSQQSDALAYESLLTAAVKLFLKRPAECQDVLGKTLEKCVNFGDVDIQYKAQFYYQLLQSGVEKTRKFLL